ncbi:MULTISPECIES: ABC transporter ATP-binding protein [unclassified Lysinibacillus]|uniref:ABC transporter ATP-binding protein n=1 Tax=unclassified Lysinibacillus TaxID=2636778 RepID=UPI00117476BD|nr:ATP-binding cassette domain-containing protein [Lysinibacillus sp. CD3-6]QPQ36015.1 ATP-binding cassette domain-containing protein [Lysinibacillus sp. JNUCC-52]UED82327.1 ATP-binding cassette domain-containing protein [Lysinibacillus sp. CD3-6]
MDDLVLEAKDVSKSFKKQIIFHSVSLSIEKGKAYGFIGHNGCGKSILFKILSGLIAPDSGEIKVFGQKLGNEVDFPKNTGIIIETPQFLEDYSGIKNLRYLAAIQNKISDTTIKATLERVGLDPKNRQPVKKYSLGMKQKLGIAQAIMEGPSLLILDEPFNGLDKTSVQNIRTLLLELKKKGVTILLTSHMQKDIELICDEVFEFNDKKLKKLKVNELSNEDEHF